MAALKALAQYSFVNIFYFDLAKVYRKFNSKQMKAKAFIFQGNKILKYNFCLFHKKNTLSFTLT